MVPPKRLDTGSVNARFVRFTGEDEPGDGYWIEQFEWQKTLADEETASTEVGQLHLEDILPGIDSLQFHASHLPRLQP